MIVNCVGRHAAAKVALVARNSKGDWPATFAAYIASRHFGHQEIVNRDIRKSIYMSAGNLTFICMLFAGRGKEIDTLYPAASL